MMNLSFAGCGFHGMYHLGVISCLQRHGKSIMQNICCYGGASAGSLAATLLATSIPMEQGIHFSTKLALNVRKKSLGALSPSFDMTHHLKEGLQHLLPKDAHKMASSRLFVSITKYPQYENSIISQFSTREELIQASLNALIFALRTENI